MGHRLWKSPKMSHLNFRAYYMKVNVARFARNVVEWDFLVLFTHYALQNRMDGSYFHYPSKIHVSHDWKQLEMMMLTFILLISWDLMMWKYEKLPSSSFVSLCSELFMTSLSIWIWWADDDKFFIVVGKNHFRLNTTQFPLCTTY